MAPTSAYRPSARRGGQRVADQHHGAHIGHLGLRLGQRDGGALLGRRDGAGEEISRSGSHSSRRMSSTGQTLIGPGF
jgi:hypothetical protein